MNTRALVILHSGFEEIEAVTPIDLLTRAGVKVVQAALSERLEVTGKNGIVLQASHHLDDVVSEPFDAVILPGGPGIQKIRKHPIICKLFKQQKAANKIVVIMAHRPSAIQECDLLLVLDKGKMLGFGPKNDVLQKLVKNHEQIK